MKWVKTILLLLIMLCAHGCILQSIHVGYGLDDEVQLEESSSKWKFEPKLWEKIQAFRINRTMTNLSLMIWLDEISDLYTKNNNMRIDELKNYATHLLTTKHNSRVYYKGRALPVIMAKVPVVEAEHMTLYKFVKRIGDGDSMGGRFTLDVSGPAIRADMARVNTGFNGQGVRMAMLDSGVSTYHWDLDDLDDDPATNDPKVIVNVSFVDHNNDGVPDEGSYDTVGHGTHVAGIAAGTGHASNYTNVGIAPGAWIMNIKVGSSSGVQDDDVVSGIDYAINNGADIINLSLDFPGYDEFSIVSMAADHAVETGVIVITGTGNIEPGIDKIGAPGNAFNVITVGAIDDKNTVDIADDVLWDYSIRGPVITATTPGGRPKPDVVAPGVDVWSAKAGWFREYIPYSGTSIAVPHVAGTVALMLQANPNLTPAQVKAILRQTARLNSHLSGLTVNDRGHGIIDAFAAVQLAQNVGNIERGQMYDSWGASTPGRHFDIIGKCWDYMTFTVGPPSSFGISITQVDYHWRDWWGLVATDYRLLWQISAQHIWIDGMYYHLGNDVHRYLFSGPRIYEKGSGYIRVRAWYQVGSVRIRYDWYMHVDASSLWLSYNGGSSWKTLIYMDVDVWDATNYPYLPSTSETVLIERKIIGDVLVNVRDLDHTEYVQINPYSGGNREMWILRYGYFGNNPDASTVKNDEYVYNRDIVVYYQGDSSDPSVVIIRKTDTLPAPNPTQNDAGAGGDAGNTFSVATSINPGSYKGILCNSDPVDTNDWYKFYAESGQRIDVIMTPPPGIDFDLQLYNPAGTLKAGSYLGAGYTDIISYTADSTGYWRARIYVCSGEAQYSFYVSVYWPGGGGCPLLYVYDGKEYVCEGLLDIHNPDGIDVVTNHTLTTTPKRVNRAFQLRLTEHPQTHSYIDQVKLFAVLQDKTMIELPLISAIHSEYGNVLPQLLSSDNWKTDLLGANWNNGTSQAIDLKFQALPPNIKTLCFLFVIEGNNDFYKV